MTAKIKTSPRHRGHDRPFRPKKVSRQAFSRVYWPYLPVILTIGFLSSLGIKQNIFLTALKHPTGKTLAYASSMQQQALLADTNKQRQQSHLPPLQLNEKLDTAAQDKAHDMAVHNYWSHNTPDGNPPWVFVANQNYTYQKLGENLAAGFNDEQAAINGWMASPHHRDNLLDPTFTEVGFGVAQSANYTSAGGGPMTVVVAFYGKQAGGEPVISSVQGDNTPSSVSVAQLATAKLPLASLATDLAIGAMIMALLIWAGKHIRALRRALITGERFAFSHPLLDVGLITIAALSYLLSRTAGLVH